LMKVYLSVTGIIVLALQAIIFFTEFSVTLVWVAVLSMLIMALLNVVLLRKTGYGDFFYNYNIKLTIAKRCIGVSHFNIFLIGLLLAGVGAVFALLLGHDTAWVFSGAGVFYMSFINIKTFEKK
jgi:hypothetical protein